MLKMSGHPLPTTIPWLCDVIPRVGMLLRTNHRHVEPHLKSTLSLQHLYSWLRRAVKAIMTFLQSWAALMLFCLLRWLCQMLQYVYHSLNGKKIWEFIRFSMRFFWHNHDQNTLSESVLWPEYFSDSFRASAKTHLTFEIISNSTQIISLC